MASKAPYYYSEIGPEKKAPEAVAVESPSAETPEEDSPVDKNQGFFNPLLSIEPDVSVPDTPRRNSEQQQKKKKKKKSKSSSPPPKSITPNGVSGQSAAAYAKHIFFGKGEAGNKKGSPEKGHKRRSSEPNIYEEITDLDFGSEQCLYTGSLSGVAIPRRPTAPLYGRTMPGSCGTPAHVREEVTRIHQTHAHILENLNLDVETMLMPDSGEGLPSELTSVNSNTAPVECQERCKGSDYGTTTHKRIHPSVSLHSPYVSHYAKTDPHATWRRVMNEYVIHHHPEMSGTLPSASKARAQWIPYPSHKTFQSAGDPYGRTGGEPLYMLYDDSHRRRTLTGDVSGNMHPDDNIYEEVDIYRRENGCEDVYSIAGSEFGGDHSGSSDEADTGSRTGSLGFAARLIGSKGKQGKKRKDSDIASSFTRWFSTRRKDFDADKINNRLGKQLSEDEGYVDVKTPKKQRPPLSLPAMPPGLTPEQIKRRLIVNSIVESENSYVGSLQRLIRDFKRPLLQGNPPIISQNKVDIMFYRLEQILQCHTIFGIALTQCVWEWDKEEKIGDIFVASFSKSMVLEIYSDFINNFTTAMDTAKQACKNKSAFSEFLKMKQIYSPDRLSFFGLMVKPVQRFPQFILLLQDLLKHTPPGHHDRMSLQLALTQLESLAETLNERKRESEQHHAVREVLKHLGSKFSLKSLADGDHYLLRQDDVLQLEVDHSGLVVKSKGRRIFLLNDLLVCVTVTPRSSDNSHSRERFSLKWAVPLQEVEVQEDITPATRNLLASSGRSRNSGGRLTGGSTEGAGSMQVLYDELTDLLHDLEVMSRIAVLVASLKRAYPELSVETIQTISQNIQEAIRQKDEEITLLDSCCLQLAIPHKSKSHKVYVCFQMSSPSVKREWTTDLRLAKLALDPDNTPAWDVAEQEKVPSSKLPLLVKILPVYVATAPTEVKCGCYYTVSGTQGPHQRIHYLWLCSSDGVNSHMVILSLHQIHLRPVGAFDLPESRITAMEAVPPSPPGGTGSTEVVPPGMADTVWITTESKRLILLTASCPDKWAEVGNTTVSTPVVQIRYHCEQVFVALSSGCVNIYRRDAGGGWDLKTPLVVTLGTDPVTCLLPLGSSMYCACGKKVWVLDGFTAEVQKSHNVSLDNESHAFLLAHSGTGLWIALKNSSTICLYHTETFRHLQDIDIAPIANRNLAAKNQEKSPSSINITSLLASRGLLWVGTNIGVIITIPLPRLEGMPIVTGRTNVSYHAHQGPVTFLLSLQPRAYGPFTPPPSISPVEADRDEADNLDSEVKNPEEEEEEEEDQHAPVTKQKSDSMLPSTPAGGKLKGLHTHKSSMENVHISGAKTLPRGMTLCYPPSLPPSPEMDVSEVYGLYADLMNVQDYDKDSHERLNRSDPELMHFQFSTLGRRYQQKCGRPRSWDLSTMEVSGDSDSSAAYDTNSTLTTTVNTEAGSCTESQASTGAKSFNSSSPSPSVSSVEGVQGLPPRSHGTMKTLKKNRKASWQQQENVQKTLLTLTGGCGYVNWRKVNEKEIVHPSGDACILIWEMKV